MIAFIRKHILMPADSTMAYYFLIFLLPSIVDVFALDSLNKWLSLILIVIFYKFYRDGYVDELQTASLYVGQLLIASLITIQGGYAGIFIFFAWSYNFWEISEKTRRKYLIWYYIASLISSVLSLYLHRDVIPEHEYQWIIVGMLFIIISPIVAGKIEKEQRRIYQLSLNNARLETIIRQNERDRIARDLHDNLGQAYSTMIIKAELAEKLLNKKPLLAQKEVQEIAQMSRSNLNLVREVVKGLQERTIASAMIEASKTLKQKDIILNTEQEMITGEWPLHIQYIFAAMIREVTTNILRHSQATLAKYRFQEDNQNYRVYLKDNGIGGLSEDKYNFGIRGLLQRIDEVDGKFSITDVHSSGTEIVITIPKEVDHD